MGKKKSAEEAAGEIGGSITITTETKNEMKALIGHMKEIKNSQELLKEGVEATAAKMGIKPAKLKNILSIIQKEEEEGGVIQQKEDELDFVRTIIEQAFE